MSTEQKRVFISQSSELSIKCRCTLLDLPRSVHYYKPQENLEETEWMNLIADIYAQRPSDGYRKITAKLRNKGHIINDKKVRRLMKIMGLRSILPKPRTTIPNKENPIYPFLLKGVVFTYANQAWGVDITYLRLSSGMVYLFALIDLYSRYIVGWRVSVTMESSHGIEAFRDGLKLGIPEICNADQGKQFTSEGWIFELTSYGVKISHVGVGRCIDNVFIERFWWTLKYEDIHLSSYETVSELRAGIGAFIRYYNEERPHQALKYKTPYEIYFGKKSKAVTHRCVG